MDQSDKLSNLPTGVTQKILSYLPIDQAVRTSILSSEWRSTWSRLPYLVFDDQSGYDIKKVVNHVLLLHRGGIETFKLSNLDGSADSENIDKWIAYLSRERIKEFVLEHTKWDPYNVFSCIFSYKGLTRLELHNCLLNPPATFKGFRMLKRLHLKHVDVSGDVLGRLIACCPQLERVILCDLKGIADVTICAPSIQFLKVQGSFEDVVLEKTFNLVDVSIDWKQGSTICSGKLLRHILQLPRIERLTLQRSFLECAVGSLTKKLPKSCLSLKFLSISIRLDNSEEILTAMHLMRSAPALEELDIVFRKGKVTNDGESTYCLSDDKQNWEFTQLQRVKVICFSGIKAEVDFIKFLLLTSPGLQELEISFGQDMKGVDFSWLDDNQKNSAFTQVRVVLERVILQPSSTEVSWELFKLLLAFKRDTLHADFKFLDPSSPVTPVQDSDDSSSDHNFDAASSSDSDFDDDDDDDD
ncbi:hypothetical protein ACLB2K_056265 [Fragaria x ananassa]